MRFAIAILLLASLASAQERYQLTGAHPSRGPAQARLVLRRVADGDLMVELRLRWERARDVETTLSGPVHLRTRERIEARLSSGGRGAAGALLGHASRPPFQGRSRSRRRDPTRPSRSSTPRARSSSRAAPA